MGILCEHLGLIKSNPVWVTPSPRAKRKRTLLSLLLISCLISIFGFIRLNRMNFDEADWNSPDMIRISPNLRVSTSGDDQSGSASSKVSTNPREICKCRNRLPRIGANKSNLPPSTLTVGEMSSCSDEGTEFGPNQKVVSFSLFIPGRGISDDADEVIRFRNTLRELFDGIQVNMDGIRANYSSGWIARVYTDLPANYSPSSCDLICKNADMLFWCDVKRIPVLGDLSGMIGRTWRFLPLGDPLVDSFVSRDLDSSISKREWEVVAEWQAMKYPIHVMRDTPYHNTHLVLAGMFGVKNSQLPLGLPKRLQSDIIRESKKIRSRARVIKTSDQIILDKFIGKPLRNLTLAHDSYFCGYPEFTAGLTLPFNTKRVGEFYVGSYRLREVPGKRPCPEVCRPSYAKDWECC